MKYERIRSLREDHDLLQKQVAEMLSIAQRTYSSYENGNHDIPTQALITLAKYYNTSVDYLLGLTDEVLPYPISKNHKK